jgi:hypothetical protein
VERVPRLSQALPAQAMEPCTMCATSAMGSSAICAPSKEQPPAVAPGLGLAQPDFSFLLCSQAGSSSSAAMSFGFMRAATSSPTSAPACSLDVVDTNNGEPMPADSDSLILAMNNGRPMAPKLMWEFPRAAMNVELKRGRGAVNRFLDELYGQRSWTRSRCTTGSRLRAALCHRHQPRHPAAGLLRALPAYLDPRHRARRRHRLSLPPAQLRRQRLQEVEQEAVDPTLPMLFKPMGSPRPDATYIASDADFVDYITELMGGFGECRAFSRSTGSGAVPVPGLR